MKYAAAALAGVSMLAAATVASANGFYVSGSVGALYRDPVDGVTAEKTDPFGNSLSLGGVQQPYLIDSRTHYDTGFDTEVAGGYRFDLGRLGAVRTELNLDYTDVSGSTIDQHSGQSPYFTTVYSATQRTASGLGAGRLNGTVNLFYDLPFFRYFTPYVGGGVGYHYGWSAAGTRTRNYSYSSPAGATGSGGFTISGPPGDTVTGQDTVPVKSSVTHDGAYLAEVGVSIPLMPRLSLVPAYRYSNIFRGTIAESAAKVGLRYNF